MLEVDGEAYGKGPLILPRPLRIQKVDPAWGSGIYHHGTIGVWSWSVHVFAQPPRGLGTWEAKEEFANSCLPDGHSLVKNPGLQGSVVLGTTVYYWSLGCLVIYRSLLLE